MEILGNHKPNGRSEDPHMKARRVAINTAAIIMVALGFVFLYLIRNVIFLIFISILLATAIEPVVNRLRRGPFSRGTGILAVYTLIMGIIALVVVLTVPPLFEEGGRFIEGLRDEATTRATIKQTFGNTPFEALANGGYNGIRGIINNPDAVDTGLHVGLSIFEAVFSAVTVFVIAFYWLTERPIIKRFVFSFVPEARRQRGRTLWDSVEQKLGSWVRGQIVLCLFILVLGLIGYTVMGLKFAFGLAVFAAIAELIPLVGPYIGGAPAILVALTQNSGLALAVLAYIVVLQLIEGNVLVPRIMEKAVGVTPLTVIVGILIGSTLYGILGALLAVPIAAAAQVTFNNIMSFGTEDISTSTAAAAAFNTKSAVLEATKANEQKRSSPLNEEERPEPPSHPAPVN